MRIGRPGARPTTYAGGQVERSVLQGLAAFRWGAWLWMTAVLVVSRHELEGLHGRVLAVILVTLALVVTGVDTALLRTGTASLLRPGPVVAELAVAVCLLVGDGLAYRGTHAFSSSTLGSVWPLTGILVAGAAFGPLAGAAAGGVVGVARVAGVAASGTPVDQASQVLSLTNTMVFYALGGAAAGYLVRLLARAEREISAARARDEVARTLHDGVLQTLAVVERRTADPALARMAREQERNLREYLFGTGGGGGRGELARSGGLGPALRTAAARFEDSFGGRAQVLVADDVPVLRADTVAALSGAVGEALVNAGKHGRAGKVTVYVEPEGAGVFCSVKDDGSGFDPAATPEGVGLSRSVRARVTEAGGRVEVHSRPGAGTEVCLWLR